MPIASPVTASAASRHTAQAHVHTASSKQHTRASRRIVRGVIIKHIWTSINISKHAVMAAVGDVDGQPDAVEAAAAAPLVDRRVQVDETEWSSRESNGREPK